MTADVGKQVKKAKGKKKVASEHHEVWKHILFIVLADTKIQDRQRMMIICQRKMTEWTRINHL
jgi:hypothetical protein